VLGDAGTVWVVAMIQRGLPQIAVYERVRTEQCSEDYDERSDARDGQDRTESFRADLRERTKGQCRLSGHETRVDLQMGRRREQE